jgi:hypothetical protein
MRRISAFGPLVILAAMLAVVQTVYGLTGAAPSWLAEVLLSYTFSLYVVFWMVLDAEERSRVPFFDFGMLAMAFFPVSLVWYVLWTRGWWRGLGVLALLFALALAPSLCGTVALLAAEALR